jgi:Tautomerase enzyme
MKSLKQSIISFLNDKKLLGKLSTDRPTQETIMPLTRVSLRRGKPAAYRKAILEGLYQAMRETFNVPESDRFMTVTEHDQDDFVYGADYVGIQRSDDLVIIQITVSNTRMWSKSKSCIGASSNG